MKTIEDKRMVKLYLFIFKTIIFELMLKKSTHSFLGAWPFLLVHIWFTPSEGPKNFITQFS